MSFTELKITELRKAAESFGIDTDVVKTKGDIIAALAEEGISFQMYNKFDTAEKQEIKVPEAEKAKRANKILSKVADQVLVKMERNNYSFETQGYAFTQEHPFVAMSSKEAQKIFDLEDGFRIATPREAQEYYA